MIDLHPTELEKLGHRIEEDFRQASLDHQRRMLRFRRYYRKWRVMYEPPRAGEQANPNFQVPFVQWQVFGAWSRMLSNIFGDDAEIVAKPVGPSDQRSVHKIARYVNWRVFDSMKLVSPLAIWFFRAILFGRSHAFAPYVERRHAGQVWYSGPDFVPLWPNDIIVPAEEPDVNLGIHGFTWVIRRRVVQPQDLLADEREGRAFGISSDWDRIVKLAEEGLIRDDEVSADEIKEDADSAEGVTRAYGQTTRGLIVHDWYGRWRLPKRRGDIAMDDWKRRSLDESEVLVTHIPQLGRVVGAQSLNEMYPHTPRVRPIVECSLVKDGSYWSPGFGEMLHAVEDELTANHRAAQMGARFSVGPVVFYEVASGFNPKTFEMEPGTAVPVSNANGVKTVDLRTDLSAAVLMNQAITAYGEKLTGVTDQSVGHSIDRPNAPDTARGQLLLAEQGNIRAELDTKFISEDLALLLEHLWFLDVAFAPRNQFFRVTEEEAKGLFDVRQGGTRMTEQEWGGRYDFRLKFATSYWSREAAKQRAIELYGIDVANPLIATNPRALWMCTNAVHKALGDDNFADVIPEPPDLGMPKNPREEWTLMLQGEEVMPNPMDNDDLHLMAHFRHLKEEQAAGEAADQDAIERLTVHIIDHQKQMRQKQLMQAMVSQLAGTLARHTGVPGAPGLNAGGGMPLSLQQLQQFLGNVNGDDSGASQQGRGKPGGKRGKP